MTSRSRGAARRDDFVEACVPAGLSITVNVCGITRLENHENKLSEGTKKHGVTVAAVDGTAESSAGRRLSRIDCRDAGARRGSTPGRPA